MFAVECPESLAATAGCLQPQRSPEKRIERPAPTRRARPLPYVGTGTREAGQASRPEERVLGPIDLGSYDSRTGAARAHHDDVGPRQRVEMRSRVTKAVIVTRLPHVHMIIVVGRAAPGTRVTSVQCLTARVEARPRCLQSPRHPVEVKAAS